MRKLFIQWKWLVSKVALNWYKKFSNLCLFYSARLALPGTEKGIGTPDKNPLPLHLPEPLQREQGSEVVKHSEPANRVTCCEPIIEEPASPEPECAQVSIADIEEAFYEDPEEIPTIRLNMDALTSNLRKIMEHNKELQDGNMSTALVALTAEAASLPMPKLKNISQLRTEHQVYVSIFLCSLPCVRASIYS